MDPIKEAFQKIKEDILLLKSEIESLKLSVQSISYKNVNQNSSFPNNLTPTNPTQVPYTFPQYSNTPTQSPTLPQEMKGLRYVENGLSTGNEGVPTDTPTYQQTNQQTDKSSYPAPSFSVDTLQRTLDSLDSIKKDIRLKFKRLTSQEMQVFSTIYSLETQGFSEISYKTIAKALNLSESSIRDYVIKILLKGIPIQKSRINNKTISLGISPSLQKLASLSTITRLREL